MIVRFAQKRRVLFSIFAHVRASRFLVQCANISLSLLKESQQSAAHNSFLLLLRLAAILKAFSTEKLPSRTRCKLPVNILLRNG